MKLGEADKLVTFFTAESGKVKGIASGACRMKNRFGASLEPFTHCTISIFEKGGNRLARIRQSDIVHSFRKLRETLDDIRMAFQMVMWVSRMTPEGEPNPAIYGLLLSSLGRMESGMDRRLSFVFFMIYLAGHSGYAPRLDCCVRCVHHSSVAYFSPSVGGMVCTGCAEGISSLISVSPETRDFLLFCKTVDHAASCRLTPSPMVQQETLMLYKAHLGYIIGKQGFGSGKVAGATPLEVI